MIIISVSSGFSFSSGTSFPGESFYFYFDFEFCSFVDLSAFVFDDPFEDLGEGLSYTFSCFFISFLE
jgi:hypothetical protein